MIILEVALRNCFGEEEHMRYGVWGKATMSLTELCTQFCLFIYNENVRPSLTPMTYRIRMFVKQVVQYAILRISSACEKHQFIDSSDIATGSLVEAGDSRALSARNKPRNTPGNTPGKRSRQPSATDPTESSAALKRQAISAPVASEPKLSPSDTSRRKSLRIEISAKQASKVVPDIVSPSLAPPSRATSKATLATPKTGAIHLADTTIEELPPILFEPSLQEPSGTTPEAVADGGGFGGSIVLKRDQTAGSINSSQLAKVSPISVPASHTPKPPEKSPVRARNMVDQATNGAGSKRATVEDITQATSQTPAVVPNPGIHRQELNNLQSERPALTLQTSIISDGASINRFMHVPGGFTLTNFLHLLSLKHRLNPTEMQRLALISVQMQEATLSIDLRDSDRDWDWEAWMELFGGKGGLVPVLVKMD